MENYNKFEEKFFKYLKRQFTQNDLVDLNKLFVPKNLSNQLIRYYSDQSSIWFSRLCLSETNKIYYFGLNGDTAIKAIIPFNNNNSKSALKFTKDEQVYLRVKINSKMLNNVNSFFTLKYVNKDKSSEIFYLDLGKIGDSGLLDNITKMTLNFTFVASFENRHLVFDRYLGNSDVNGESINKISLKRNMEIISIINSILKKNLNHSASKNLIEYLFSKNEKGDYIVRTNLLNRSGLTQFEFLNVLKNCIIEIDNSMDFDDIKNIITQKIKGLN